MKTIRLYIISLIAGLLQVHCIAQSNLLGNGGFEGSIPNGDYPHTSEWFQDRSPQRWYPFNSGGEVRWFVDSIWTPIGINGSNPQFQNGFYKVGDFNSTLPWGSGYAQDTLFRLTAHQGRFFAGFDTKTDGPLREGIQSRVTTCELNSGNYNVELFFARAYGSAVPSRIFLSLSDSYNSRRRIFDDFTITHPSINTGQWEQKASSFSIDINDMDDMEDDWLSITGQVLGDSDPRNYIFFDDIRLYRPCDDALECSPTHGQICPTVATMAPPGDILRISNISNAKDLRLKIYMNNGAIIKDTTWHNANGMPDFRFTRLDLPISTAPATYQYDLRITNDCGGFRKTGSVFVQDTASYNPVTLWSDPTANWTGVPIPCCLDQLFLQNTQIVGDVSYIVRDQITVLNGVSMAPNSHVTLQAGQVVELYGVDFDGTTSTLEIVEVPCPNRMACGQGCAGGSMVMDAGEFVMPVQVAADSQATVKGNVTPTAPTEIAKPAIAAETRLWAYPNPFEKEFQIGIALPTPMACTVLVQDLQLRPIRTVTQDKELPAGSHQLNVDLAGLPAGVYLVQLQAGGRNYHQRVVKQ
jgi:hypothetical protein